jgi:hypothetical protein
VSKEGGEPNMIRYSVIPVKAIVSLLASFSVKQCSGDHGFLFGPKESF